MKPLPEKIKPEIVYHREDSVSGTGITRMSQADTTINTLIDHLTDYEAEQNRRYKELDNSVQTIANNQLGVKRGETTSGIVTEEKLILEDGDNQIILDKNGMEALYQELRTLLRKEDY